MIAWALALALGLVLLITGTLPLGRFPSFTSGAAFLRSPYGRILGAAIILYLFWIRLWGPSAKPTLTIVLSIGLLLVAIICIILSMSEKVR
jgi:hypothetical protein